MRAAALAAVVRTAAHVLPVYPESALNERRYGILQVRPRSLRLPLDQQPPPPPPPASVRPRVRRSRPAPARAELTRRGGWGAQGVDKELAKRVYGDKTVGLWRRSVSKIPPGGESMQQCAHRAVGFFGTHIEPRCGPRGPRAQPPNAARVLSCSVGRGLARARRLAKGENVLLCAHGNSIRTIFAHVSNLSAEESLRLKISTAAPLLFQFDGFKYHFNTSALGKYERCETVWSCNDDDDDDDDAGALASCEGTMHNHSMIESMLEKDSRKIDGLI
eukprot:scaffold1915_cov288-Prasinococcus_capsulatus_cf.AAC.2